MRSKPYNAPFWIMFSLAMLLTISTVASYLLLLRYQRFARDRPLYNYWSLLWILLLWTETIIYRVIRRRIVKKHFVWLHIISLFFLFVGLPILSGIVRVFISTTSYYSVFFIQRIAYWILFGISHAFFIATLVKSFSRKPVVAADDESADMLSGLIEED